MLQQQPSSGSQRSQSHDQSKGNESASKNESGRNPSGEVSGVQATINMLLTGNNPRPTPQQLDELKKALEKEPALAGFTLENLRVQPINGESVITAVLTKDGEPKAAVAFRKQSSSPTAMYVGIDPGKRSNVLTSDFSSCFCLSLNKDDRFTKAAIQGLSGAPETHSLAMVDAQSGRSLSADIFKTRSNFDPNRPTTVLDGQQRVNATNSDPRLMELSVNDGGKVYHPEKAEFSTEKGARVVKVYYKVDGEMREATFRCERFGKEIEEQILRQLKDATRVRDSIPGIGGFAAASLTKKIEEMRAGDKPPPP